MRRIEPIRVFELFELISQIPRCTGDEEAISNYLVDFSKNLGLEVNKDQFGNVIIKKDATKGYETSATIILQGHMDMLCIKAQDSEHDFSVDALKLSVSGDLIMADNTALGADNGIALAFYMALLESNDIPHPPLEVVLTVQEQAGLIGARALDVTNLLGRYLINMDSESEGEFIIGCAGEKRVHLTQDLERETHDFDMESIIRVSGLKGGHSGLNIHQNRGNAGQLMAHIYRAISEVIPVALISMCGGEKYNVIPNYGELKISMPHDAVETFKSQMEVVSDVLEDYLNEPGIQLEFDICPIHQSTKVLSDKSTEQLMDLILMLPIGVNSLSDKSTELVDTSLNLGILRVHDDLANIKISVRSMTAGRLDVVLGRLKILTKLTKANMKIENTYPAWNDEGDNHLRRVFRHAYKEQCGEAPTMRSIHAGLECSILAQKLNDRALLPAVEMISFGPDIFDAHTPEEAVSISSIRRTWELFQHILKQLRE